MNSYFTSTWESLWLVPSFCSTIQYVVGGGNDCPKRNHIWNLMEKAIYSWRSWTLCYIQEIDENLGSPIWEAVTCILHATISQIICLKKLIFSDPVYLIGIWICVLCEESGQWNDRENDVNLSQIEPLKLPTHSLPLFIQELDSKVPLEIPKVHTERLSNSILYVENVVLFT